jgi:Uma2 family endonuclease
MSSAVFGHGTALTEEEFFALDVQERVELMDGSLLVTPAPTPRHQYISSELRAALQAGARSAGLFVLEAVNVRLQPSRILIPDLVVTEPIDFDEPAIDATSVVLVCEIVSPSNAANDYVLKMSHYATAGIPWYLIVEQSTGNLRLFRLEHKHYIEHSITKMGDPLYLNDPVEVTIRPEDLLPPG